MVLPLLPNNVADEFNMFRASAQQTFSYVKGVQAGIASGSVDSFYLLTAISVGVTTLQYARAIINGTARAAAFRSYLQTLSGDPNLDAIAEITTTQTALLAVVTAMVQEYPKSAGGYLRDRRFDASGTPQWDTILGTALPNTNAAITAWLATIG